MVTAASASGGREHPVRKGLPRAPPAGVGQHDRAADVVTSTSSIDTITVVDHRTAGD
jgi:hypothetical protein